jgi:hypothetical protein
MTAPLIPQVDSRPIAGETVELSVLATCQRVITEYAKWVEKTDKDLVKCRATLAEYDKLVDSLRNEVAGLRSANEAYAEADKYRFLAP